MSDQDSGETPSNHSMQIGQLKGRLQGMTNEIQEVKTDQRLLNEKVSVIDGKVDRSVLLLENITQQLEKAESDRQQVSERLANLEKTQASVEAIKAIAGPDDSTQSLPAVEIKDNNPRIWDMVASNALEGVGKLIQVCVIAVVLLGAYFAFSGRLPEIEGKDTKKATEPADEAGNSNKNDQNVNIQIKK